MGKREKRVPELRFKGFEDDWEQRKLGELAKVRTGKAFRSTDFSDEGEYLVVTNKNIQDESNGITSVGDRINVSEKSILKNYLLSGDNILVTMDGVNIGKTGKFSNDKAVLAQRVGRLTAIQLEFVYQITSSNKFVSVMNRLSVGNAIKHISLKQISDYSFPAPVDEEEQEKIGTFLKLLDNTIALHQEKLSQLNKVKLSFLQKVFPLNGQTKADLKFTNFDNEWEQRKFSEIVDFFSGLTYSPDSIVEKGTLVLRSSNIQNGEIVDADNVYVNPKVVNSKNVKVGDVIVVVRNGSRNLIGKHAPIKKEMSNTVIGAFMTGVRSSVPSFTNSLLNSTQFYIEIHKNLGATINQITTGVFKKMEFTVPIHHEEKEKIGQFFEQLDNTIALHRQKLNKLKELKKAYLQKMFI